jgi:Transposase DDE domain
MRQRRETVEPPFGTIKARMGAIHFLMKTLKRVSTEMALHVLAYNLTRIMNIVGVQSLLAAIPVAELLKTAGSASGAVPGRKGR